MLDPKKNKTLDQTLFFFVKCSSLTSKLIIFMVENVINNNFSTLESNEPLSIPTKKILNMFDFNEWIGHKNFSY